MSRERKILRRICGPVCINGAWRIKSNRELGGLFNRPGIVTEIKSRRIEWLGHILRTDSRRVPQKILDGRSEGERSISRSRLRWLDDDVNDFEIW
jgi:hypothetical protein